MTPKTRVFLLKGAVWAGASWPLVQTGWRWFFGDRLGANPLEVMILGSGLSAIVLLIASLAVTPLRRVTGWNDLQKLRRLLGLWAFAYAFLHVSVYLWLDQGWAWEFIVEDVTERPFIIAGTLTFLLLVPLAVTSTRGWIRRLGKNWVRLHRLVYPAAGLGLLHYAWGQKADLRGPVIAGVLLALFLGFRVWRALAARRGAVAG
jgi:sulfoxide reductase heme-binding subunit YedZ